MLVILFGLVSSAYAQEAVEAAYVRGHLSYGSDIWRADDFGWFYYDLDKDLGGEELRIDMQGRTAEKGHIVYSSKTWSQQFEYEPWGSFQAVAFLGKPYLAGYPESIFTGEVSSLGKGALRRILIDVKDEYTLTYNNTMPLMNGYVLTVAEISEKSDVVNFVLLKNNKPVHRAVVSIGGTYTFKIDEVPIILVHLANAMSSENSGFAEVDGIFQVSDEPVVRLFEGGRLGNMKMSALTEEGIEFQSDRSFTLLKNSEVPLTDGFALIVANSDELIYYPVGGIYDYGVHEIRGPAFSGSRVIPAMYGENPLLLAAKWNSGNYTNFYMDPERQLGSWNQLGSEDQFGSETLVLQNINGRTVLPPTSAKTLDGTVIFDGFLYTAIMRSKDYDYEPWGSYYIVPFLGETWFAGYDRSLDGKQSSLNLFDHEKIGRVLIDTEIVQGNVVAGNYSLEEGYEFWIRDVETDKIFIQLMKNGILQDSSVVKSNSTYIYKKDLDDVDDMPIIKLHFSNVFSNGSSRFATIDAIFQISDEFLVPIESGLGIGKLQTVSTSQPYAIIMVNDETINLNSDSTISLAPNMNIRVADNDTLRYYLYSQKYVVPRPAPPQIALPANVASSTPANFSMLVKAAEIREVTAYILDSNNRTVFSRDITGLGQGSGDLWGFAWKWNATTMQLSDDKSLVLDTSGSSVGGLLYLNSSASPRQVGVIFDSIGRIGAILDNEAIYYISPSEYKGLNNSLDYDAMLANNTVRNQFIKIEPGKSILQFLDIINGRLAPSGINHTLQGNLEAIEPRAIVVGAKPGRYELRVRVENAVDAIQTFGEFINVTPAEMRGISLGVAQAFAGEEVSVPLRAPNSNSEKIINISYDAARLKATSISGECNATWQVDVKQGRIGVFLPGGCGAANLTFAVSNKALVNDTIKLNVTGTSGFKPETVSNGTITIVEGDKRAKKSHALGILATLVALAAGAYAWRRR
ncbi:MAG: S-layer protein domain-containing protein [Methanothrix sp.]|nr:S-layer protein domain-containing protein [Methanothrix sp.]